MTRPRFASALSTDPQAAVAEERCLASLEAQLDGAAPDLLVAFASHHHGDVLDGWPARLRAALGARHLVGCSGLGIVGGEREVEDRPALSLWAATLPGTRVTPRRVRVEHLLGGGARLEGMPDFADPELGSLLLFGDPYTFPVTAFLDELGERHPGLPVAGGMASGGRGAGQNLLFLDDEVHQDGAVAIELEGAVEMCTAVSQGCRPVGSPLVITACRENVVLKLRGRKAAKVLIETLESLPADEQELFRRGTFIGLALDATKSHFEPSDLLVRNILGLLPQEDAVAVSDGSIRPGMSVQFMVRDSASASHELEAVLRQRGRDWSEERDRDESGALLFTCSGRGSRMFGELHHDARRVQQAFGPELPLAGFFANGEIGPVGGRNFVHGFTASVALFRQRT